MKTNTKTFKGIFYYCNITCLILISEETPHNVGIQGPRCFIKLALVFTY